MPCMLMHSQMVAVTKNDIGPNGYPSIAGSGQRRGSKMMLLSLRDPFMVWRKKELEGSWLGHGGPPGDHHGQARWERPGRHTVLFLHPKRCSESASFNKTENH